MILNNEPLVVPVDMMKYPVTWVDGRILFKHNEKWANFFYGICHKMADVFAITPVDWIEATAIITIHAGEISEYCDRSKTCLNMTCPINRLNKEEFVKEFKDCGPFTLGLPRDFGTKPFWFNEYPYNKKWKDFMIPKDGGVLRYNEHKV